MTQMNHTAGIVETAWVIEASETDDGEPLYWQQVGGFSSLAGAVVFTPPAKTVAVLPRVW